MDLWTKSHIYFFYLLKLRGRRGRVAQPIIAVHIKYYKYVLQKLTVGAIEIWTQSGSEKEMGEKSRGKQMVAPWLLQEEAVHFH
jgi:hypothetical protein